MQVGEFYQCMACWKKIIISNRGVGTWAGYQVMKEQPPPTSTQLSQGITKHCCGFFIDASFHPTGAGGTDNQEATGQRRLDAFWVLGLIWAPLIVSALV